MNDQQLLDDFGKLLISKVRDNALDDLLSIVEGRMKSPLAKQMSERINSTMDETGKQALKMFAMNMVDRTLHYLLTLIEENKSICLSFKNDAGEAELVQISDGLAGELYSDEGWISEYSKHLKSL